MTRRRGGDNGHVHREDVVTMVRQAILAGRLRPGEKLSEERLAAAFRVSRTPVREALLQLAKEEFISLVPNRGAFVKSISSRDAQELYAVREVIEGLVTRLAALNLRRGDRRRLQALIRRMRRAAVRRDLREYRRLHGVYSDLINDAHGNRWLAEFYTLLMRHVQRLEAWNFTERRLPASIREHQKILTHLIRGDPAGAEEAARAHQRSALKALLGELNHHAEITVIGDGGEDKRGRRGRAERIAP